MSYLILKKSDKIIVPSQSYKIFLETNFKFALDKDVVVYPSGGIDCNIFYANKNKRLNCYRLGFAGRLVRSKNIHLILETLPYINDYTLDIIGEGPELQSLQLLVNKLNIQDRVLFIGAKSQRDLADWYRNIDCLIYPSESESLGLVPIEAMACGVSVILSDIPAFRELKSTGFIVNIIDDMTARAIYEKIKHVEIYDSNPFFNSNLVEKLYSSDNVKKDLINVFK
ncbi:group 1 glycosyl transferase [Aliivibrio fischeri SR5]|uniref:Group 1 glycosyl transferase n=1 Tax=Aliivibrio fischeri SR5 TaxID=1088719 RepID=A0AAV3EXD5_ALIFS|nr:group 1 glycosyl transferase [Aliivibrio fischeri SR5]